MKLAELGVGTIGLTRITGWKGVLVWLLQALNGDFSRWTHVFVVLDDQEVFEAQPGGAVISPLEKYVVPVMDGAPGGFRYRAAPGRQVAFVDWPLTAEQRRRINVYARSHENVGYNWGTYLYLAAYRLRIPLLTQLLRRRVASDRRLICSQAADHFYALAGVQLFDNALPYDVTPGDFRLLPLKILPPG